MSYAQLYAYCQGLTVRIGRRHLFPKVSELTKIPKPRLQISGRLDPEILRGFIVFPDGTSHRLSQYCNGRPLIVVARELDEAWQRFVMIKELMHYFDLALEKVSSKDEFESLVSEISGAPYPDQSPAMHSEAKALWMVLGVVCPEEQRQEFQRLREAGAITDAEIADKLGIPPSVVTHLFEPHFKAIISGLLETC